MFYSVPTQNTAAEITAFSAPFPEYAARADVTAMYTPAHWPDRLWIEVIPYIVHAGTPADASRYMRMLGASRTPLALRVLRHTIAPN